MKTNHICALCVFMSIELGWAAIGTALMDFSGTARAAAAIYVPDNYPTLGSAIGAATDGDTIYVRYGSYPVETTRIAIAKSLAIIGLPDTLGNKPVITGSAANGVLQVNVPGKAFELDNMEIKSTYASATPNSLRIVDNIGSSLFVVRDCKIWGQSSTSALPGIGCALACGAPTYSNLPSVTGSIIVQNTELYARTSGIFIGWFGPVADLDYIEVSNCNVHAWGGSVLPCPINQGNWGIGICHYPYYVLLGNYPPELEGTKPTTRTVISNNTVTCGFPIWTQSLKGDQQIYRNRVYSRGMISWGGVYINNGIGVSTFAGDNSCSANVSYNDIHIWIPTNFPQALTQAIGLGSEFFKMVEGDFVNGTASHNTVDLEADSVEPSFGINTSAVTRNIVVSNNDLSGLAAGVAQLMVGQSSVSNIFVGNVFGGVAGVNPESLEPVSVGGIVCDGSYNQFMDNDFRKSGIQGWAVGPQYAACAYLSELSGYNYLIESGMFPHGSGGAHHQCLDYGTSNRVVGLKADNVTSPGIGQIIQSRVSAARAKSSVVFQPVDIQDEK